MFSRAQQTNQTLEILAVSLMPEDQRAPKHLQAFMRYKNEPGFAALLETPQAQCLNIAELGRIDRKLIGQLAPRPRKTVDLKRPDLSDSSQLLTLQNTPRARLLRFVARIATKFHLVPKTLAGRGFLKKIFFGELTPYRGITEFAARDDEIPQPVRLDPIGRCTGYSVLYAVGRLDE